MKVKALVAFKSKLFSPCKKLFRTFRFKLRKPVFIKALRFHARRNKTRNAPSKNQILTTLLSAFNLRRKLSTEMDRVAELRSVSEARHERKLFPSPLTPAYIKASRTSMSKAFGSEDVEDACGSFENYLVEMIVEEGKVRDLMDVEELLYCWKNLKCPVFIDLVCRFYGELCKDLFLPEDDNNNDIPIDSADILVSNHTA
ncbi:transcription repressor OFP17 [Jatropha curcas]|nr:transcription repressor OFP17 [Jatropha curcas]